MLFFHLNVQNRRNNTETDEIEDESIHEVAELENRLVLGLTVMVGT